MRHINPLLLSYCCYYLVFRVVRVVRAVPCGRVGLVGHQVRKVLSCNCLQRHTHTPIMYRLLFLAVGLYTITVVTLV